MKQKLMFIIVLFLLFMFCPAQVTAGPGDEYEVEDLVSVSVSFGPAICKDNRIVRGHEGLNKGTLVNGGDCNQTNPASVCVEKINDGIVGCFKRKSSEPNATPRAPDMLPGPSNRDPDANVKRWFCGNDADKDKVFRELNDGTLGVDFTCARGHCSQFTNSQGKNDAGCVAGYKCENQQIIEYYYNGSGEDANAISSQKSTAGQENCEQKSRETGKRFLCTSRQTAGYREDSECKEQASSPPRDTGGRLPGLAAPPVTQSPAAPAARGGARGGNAANPNQCDGVRDAGGFPQRCDLSGAGMGDGVQWCVGGLHSDDPSKEPYKCMADPDARIGSTCYALKNNGEPDLTRRNRCGPSPTSTGSVPQAPAAGAVQPVTQPAPQQASQPAPGESLTDKVTLCGQEMILAQARVAVGMYGGSRAAVSAEYLKRFCPGSQNDCKLIPDHDEIKSESATPPGYIWVANCSKACMRNNSTGNQKDLAVDPNPEDPAACPKNYNDPNVNPATSNWCYGFSGSGENNNRCMTLWSKEKYEQIKNTRGALFNLGQAPQTAPAQPAGAPRPSAALSIAPAPSTVPSTAPSVPPAGSNGWIKASCDGNRLLNRSCSLPGAGDCSDWGKNEEAYRLAGWNEGEYNRCRDFCTELTRNGGIHARACIVSPVSSNRWNKASCSNNILSGCHLPSDAKGCMNWGLDTEAFRLAGWTEGEYNKCKAACTALDDPANGANPHQAACRVLSSFTPSPAPSLPPSPNSPSRDKNISGKIVQQVYSSNKNSCRTSPLERIKVSIYEEGQEKMDTFTGADGFFNYTVKSDKTYTIKIPDKSTVVVATDGKWDKEEYLDQKEGKPGNDCGEDCNFTFNRKICESRPNPSPSPGSERQTAQFRITENRSDLSVPEWGWTAYTRGGVRYPFSFSNMAPGQSRTIFVQFRDHEKQLITDSTHTKGIYTLNVQLKAPASSPPVSVAPSVVPTPVPTAVPPPPADNCVLGEPGVASYPGEAGSKEWCDCANNNKDYGSQINYNCPAVQCENLLQTSPSVCGGRLSTYDNCTPKCVNGKRIYVCSSSKNQNCTTGEDGIECSLEDSQCQAPQPVQDTCATKCGACPATTDRCGNYVYTGGCDYSTCKSPTDTYKCVAPGNSACVGIDLPCGSVCGGGSSDENGEP